MDILRADFAASASRSERALDDRGGCDPAAPLRPDRQHDFAAEPQIVRGVRRRVRPLRGSGADLAGATQPPQLEASGICVEPWPEAAPALLRGMRAHEHCLWGPGAGVASHGLTVALDSAPIARHRLEVTRNRRCLRRVRHVSQGTELNSHLVPDALRTGPGVNRSLLAAINSGRQWLSTVTALAPNRL